MLADGGEITPLQMICKADNMCSCQGIDVSKCVFGTIITRRSREPFKVLWETSLRVNEGNHI